MGVPSVSGNNSVYTPEEIHGTSTKNVESLGTDALLALYSDQLDTANKDIKEQLNKLSHGNDVVAALGSYVSELSALRSTFNAQGAHDMSAKINADPKLSESQKKTLTDALKNTVGLPGSADQSDKSASENTFDATAKVFNDMIDTVKGGQSEAQAFLQDLVPKRTQMTQLFSNLIASINDASKSIIQNTRLIFLDWNVMKKQFSEDEIAAVYNRGVDFLEQGEVQEAMSIFSFASVGGARR